MNPTIFAVALGLAATAGENDILEGIEKLKTERDGARVALEETREKLARLESSTKAAAAAARQTAIAAQLERAVAEGRFLAGSKSETHAKKIAERGDLEGLTAFIDDFEKGGAAPIGTTRQSAGADPTPKTNLTVTLSAEDRKAAKRLGISEDEYAKELATMPSSAPPA